MEIHKCMCTFQGSGEIEIVDLVFMDGVPHVVISWTIEMTEAQETRYPEYAIQLDPQYLTDLPATYPARYFYTQTLQDPEIPGSRAHDPRG